MAEQRTCIGDRTDPTIATARVHVAEQLRAVRWRGQPLARGTLTGITIAPQTAQAFLRAAARRPDSIDLDADIDGDLRIAQTIPGDLAVLGSVGGHLAVLGSVGGHLAVFGSVGGNLAVSESVGGNLAVWRSVGGDLAVSGSVGGDLAVLGSVGGHLAVFGSVGGNLAVWRSVGGDLAVSGSVGGDLAVRGSVAGRVAVTPFDSFVILGSVRGAKFEGEVFIGDRVRVDQCDFRQCPDLDKFHFVGGDLFGEGRAELANPPLGVGGRVPDREMATIYRQLRNNLETRKNRPASGVFYRGEMNARRADARQSGRWVEWLVLTGYQWMSGYGLRVGPPLAWFAAIALLASVALHTGGLDLEKATDKVYAASFIESVLFTLRTMLSFFSPPDAEIGVPEQVLQLGLRFVGPILLAQIILAVRERVAR